MPLLPQTLIRGPAQSSDEYVLLRDVADMNPRHSVPKHAKQSCRDGHHFGLLCCMISAIVVLLINILLCIVPSAKHEAAGSYATLGDGDCGKMKRLDLWLHLLINILSTMLLGASNYSMQCLAAPTREDLDKAHRENSWMDIGVPSMRNICRISWPRKIMWCCLALSSIPLHLMYNSVIFSSTSLSEPLFFVVTDDFLSGATFTLPTWFTGDLDDAANRLQRLRNSTTTTYLDIKGCSKAYGSTGLISTWGDALAVTTTLSTSNSLLWTGQYFPYEKIICAISSSGFWGDVTCHRGSMTYHTLDGDSGSILSNTPISYCLAEKARQRCRIRFSIGLMTGVIACNLFKIICMGYMVWRLDSRPLVTVGDALASFLECPDPVTKGKCLVSKLELQKAPNKILLPTQFQPRRHRRLTSASVTRWLLVTALTFLTLAATATLLALGTAGFGKEPFTLGFGAIDTDYLINVPISSVEANALLANTPQLILSLLYFAYNGLWTCMLLVEEWTGYFRERKPLRVTSRSGQQRSTYRLQLPYRYGIPLMIISATLHWLVSQSIFLVVLDHYTNEGIPDPGSQVDVLACGYPPIAILTTVIVGFLVLLVCIAAGFRRYPEVGMPLAGSCSLAISAACHPPPDDDRPSEKPVMWGALKESVIESDTGEEDSSLRLLESQQASSGNVEGPDMAKVGHCTFTSLPVEEPVKGRLYAGVKSKLS